MILIPSTDYSYTIHRIPPSNNKFIGRKAEWEYQEIKKQWAALINVLCKPKPPIPLEGVTVTLRYFFPDGRRRDPDNYSGKIVLDGLVKCGILKDDSFNCIDLEIEQGGVDKENPRVEIMIKED
ncbi:MAG: RusA family crossover junction endodeoxyribonuclease [Ruminiclostridium sp.]|nr:RusA family crossover junction endodeoxyribonuclease [Ruminiclostridium sp.]